MQQVSQLILQILTQIGGGPGATENNLVRFALPTIFWAVLFAVAWSRRRQGSRAREKLLLWGCGLAFFREFFMLAHMSEKILNAQAHAEHSTYIEPLEHALSIAAIIFIAGAFMRYVLDDAALPKRYLALGLTILLVSYPAIALWWPAYAAGDTHLRFNMTVPALVLHIVELLFIAAAVVILVRHRERVGDIVIVALSLLFVSELILLFNFLTGRSYAHILCPIGNNLHIWAVPVFGFVYFHEQAAEKRRAEAALVAYRDHLEELVEARTAELQQANQRLERAAILEERQRIAAEMHDGLAQTLSSMGLKNSQAAAFLQAGKADQVARQFEEMQEMIGGAVTDVRRSIASLQHSPRQRLSLQDALVQVAEETAAGNGGPAIEASLVNEPINLDGSDQEQVLRVVQEALLNACRHAEAQQIMINLEHTSGEYHLSVRDNGIGFDPAETDREDSHHFGLSIMQARASRIEGSLSIESSPGNGTSVQLSWPAKEGQRPQNGRTSVGKILLPT